jgi:di/tricarboxylate transporter
MNLVALLIVPVVIRPIDSSVRWGIVALSAAMIALAVIFNRSGSLKDHGSK